MTIQKPSTLVEFIIRSLRPYVQDPSRRASEAYITSTGEESIRCVYHETDTGKGCAFGQWLSPEELINVREGHGIATNWESLPLWITNLFPNTALAIDVQALHDLSGNWSPTEPSSYFLQALEDMCSRYSLPHDEIVAGLNVPA
jgi:hypothetical protein